MHHVSVRKATLRAALLLATVTCPAFAQLSPRVDPQAKPQVKTVVVVGCAARGEQPQIWRLTHAGGAVDATGTAQTAADREAAAKRALGGDTYELVGIADFVSVEDSLKVGNRKDLYTPAQVNATGALAPNAKVAVKGMVVSQAPPRINVTSVVKLADACP